MSGQDRIVCPDCGANPLLYPCHSQTCPYREPEYTEEWDTPNASSEDGDERTYTPIGPTDRLDHAAEHNDPLLEAVKADRRPHWNDTIAALRETLKALNIDTGATKK